MFLLLLLSVVVVCEKYAVLLSGIYNIMQLASASESDVFQAHYQLSKLGDIPDENIIIMAMDGVVNHAGWPWPGKAYAYPGGPDVYPGSDRIDYKGTDVNADTFLKVLQGIDPGCGSGKVLKPTEDDTVFVLTISHGSVGMFYFVDEHGQFVGMHASDFQDAVKKITAKEIVFYFNSCYSGSMFDGFLDPQGSIAAVTGAPIDSEAWACCQNRTGSITIYTASCLHHNWQYDSRNVIAGKKMDSTSLDQQFNSIQNLKQSKELYCEYGNLDSAKKWMLDSFQGATRSLSDENVGGDPMCQNNAPVQCHDYMHDRSVERDLKNKRIWDNFRDILGLGEKGEEEPNMRCTKGLLKDAECHRDAMKYGFEKCNFYMSYLGTNPVHISDACNAAGISVRKIMDTLDFVCADINPEYVMEMYSL